MVLIIKKKRGRKVVVPAFTCDREHRSEVGNGRTHKGGKGATGPNGRSEANSNRQLTSGFKRTR